MIDAAPVLLLANAGDVGAWLTFSDALVREGRSKDAIDGLQAALKTMPNDADLLDQLESWLPGEAARVPLFAANAAKLYGFGDLP